MSILVDEVLRFFNFNFSSQNLYLQPSSPFCSKNWFRNAIFHIRLGTLSMKVSSNLFNDSSNVTIRDVGSAVKWRTAPNRNQNLLHRTANIPGYDMVTLQRDLSKIFWINFQNMKKERRLLIDLQTFRHIIRKKALLVIVLHFQTVPSIPWNR